MRPRERIQRSRDYGWNSRPGANRAVAGRKIAALLTILIALCALSGGLYFLSQRSNIVTDASTLCPVDRPVQEVSEVILDVSDSLSELQILAIKNDFKRLQQTVPRHGLIEVFTLQQAASTQPQSFIQLCNPGTGAELNSLYQNPVLAQRRWEASFDARLSEEIDRLLRSASSDESPIYEAIQTTAIRGMGKPEFDGVQKRLIIISDLLHNVRARQSHYQGVPDMKQFRESAYYRQIRSDLSGVGVEIYYIRQPLIAVQGGEHIRFWESFFADQGAMVLSVKSIEGDR